VANVELLTLTIPKPYKPSALIQSCPTQTQKAHPFTNLQNSPSNQNHSSKFQIPSTHLTLNFSGIRNPLTKPKRIMPNSSSKPRIQKHAKTHPPRSRGVHARAREKSRTIRGTGGRIARPRVRPGWSVRGSRSACGRGRPIGARRRRL
jgi:hypothetical protein